MIGRVESAEEERTIRAEPDALFRGWPIVVLADDVARNPGRRLALRRPPGQPAGHGPGEREGSR